MATFFHKNFILINNLPIFAAPFYAGKKLKIKV